MSDTPKHKIMIVDDSPNDIHMLLEALQGDYQVSASTSGEDALEALKDGDLPEIILLDVSMPGMDGYETCRRIKSNFETEKVEVIFLSANDSTEEILVGLDCGAIDYIVKPYDLDVLTSKIQKALNNIESKKAIEEQVAYATKIATTAMSDSGDQGIILNFMRSNYQITTSDGLVTAIVDTFSQFGLAGSVYFEKGAIENAGSTSGEICMLELEVLHRLKAQKAPTMEKRGRLIIGRDNIWLFIKKLPDDEEKLGRIKDYLMIMLEGANAKLNELDMINSVSKARNAEMDNIINTARTSLTSVQAMHNEHKGDSVKILDEMQARIEESFLTMGLTETQEEQIVDIVSSASSKMLDNFDRGDVIDEKFMEIITMLSNAAKNM